MTETVKLKNRILLVYKTGWLKVMFTRAKLGALDYGETMKGKRWVLINPRRSHGHLVEVIKTLIHEAIHNLKPAWHHDKVYREEQEVWKLLSAWEQQHLLLWAIDNGVWRDC